MEKQHDYHARLRWNGAGASGTASYTAYGRGFEVLVDGKPPLTGSADPLFRGDPDRHNPEDLFVAAVSACHMLTYLALCARRGVRVLAYEDAAVGRLVLRGGSGRFEDITLSPVVRVDPSSDAGLAAALHDEAHTSCFIAASCAVPVHHQPRIDVGGAP